MAEVAAHLVWGAELYAELIRRALAGNPEPPADSGAGVDRTARDAVFAGIGATYRRELGDGLLDAFSTSGRSLVDLFESLQPDDWQRPAPHPARATLIRTLLTQRIVELAVHGLEMLHRVGRDAKLPEGSYAVLVDWLPNRVQGRSFAGREPLVEPLRYLFVLGAPLLRTVQLHIYGDRLEIDPEWDQSGSDAVLTLAPQTYLLLFMGRLTWRRAIDEGAVSVTGRQDLAADLDGWFPSD